MTGGNTLPVRAVERLLRQSASPYDVPEGDELADRPWLMPTVKYVLARLQDENATAGHERSVAAPGCVELWLPEPSAPGLQIHVRVSGPGDAGVTTSSDKSVAMTLAGEVGFEAYRGPGDVADDNPWYVRDFLPEALYACHPGVTHKLVLTDGSVQVVIREADAAVAGRPLTQDEYADASGRIRAALRAIVDRDDQRELV